MSKESEEKLFKELTRTPFKVLFREWVLISDPRSNFFSSRGWTYIEFCEERQKRFGDEFAGRRHLKQMDEE